MESKATFITNTISLLSLLIDCGVANHDATTIKAETNGNIIVQGSNRYFNVTEMRGSGEFIYDKTEMQTLIKILCAVSERPIVIELGLNIYIKEMII